MAPRTYLWRATALSAAGVAFAGYLSAVKATSGVCAFNEPCPFFLGYPACYFGLGLFAALFAVSATALAARVESTWPVIANVLISSGGVLFAGRMTAIEVVSNGRLPFYGMGLPTCAYGLVFFVAVVVVSALALRGHGGAGRLVQHSG